MQYEELKHVVDGRFKLQWNWGLKRRSEAEREQYALEARRRGLRGKDLDMPEEWYFFYWLSFNSKEDAQEHYERMVKPFWPVDVKWEIVDQRPQTPLVHSDSRSS